MRSLSRRDGAGDCASPCRSRRMSRCSGRVPAWVCQQCGEPYFEEREVEAIQNLIQSVEHNAKRIAAAP